jgi:hypothetical protein
MRRFSFVLLALVLSSCGLRTWVDVTIDPSNTGTVTLLVASDQELRDGLSSISQGIDPVASITSGLEDEGWTVTPSTDGEWQGVEATHDFADLAELESLVSQAGRGTGISIIDNGRGYSLSADLTAPTLDGQNADLFAQASDAIKLDGRLSVRFPGRVISTNGAVNDTGDTVTWTYDASSINGLTLEAEVRKPVGIVVPIASGLGAVAIALLVWWMIKRRAVETNPEPEPDGAADGDDSPSIDDE